MKIVRFKINEIPHFGVLSEELVTQVLSNPFSEKNFILGETFHLAGVELLVPVEPRQIIAVGYNYKDLVGEKEFYDEPVLFLKSINSLLGSNQTIEINGNLPVWTEVELAIVIGKKIKNASIEEASLSIFGYTIANDVTMKNMYERDHHLARSKSWDTFCPVGPFIETDLDTQNLKMFNHINGVTFQESTTANRILNDVELISFISKFFTLFPGDLILSGTPANAMNSLVNDGDTVTVSIEKLGELTNKVLRTA